MDLASMQDAFDRVTKKQKLSYAKTEDVIDKFMHEIQAAAAKLEQSEAAAAAAAAGVVDQGGVLSELQAKLGAAASQLSSAQKDVNLALSKYGKVVDKNFCSDLSKAYRDMDFDHRLVNQIIALHFYRQGLFDLGDCFVSEALDSESAAAALKVPFFEMYQILEHMRNRNLEPAIEWAKSHHKELKERGSSLEFKLHQLEFVQTLLKSGRWEALLYGRRIFGRFPDHLGVIKKLMACMVYFSRDDGNPYRELLAPSHWESVALEFTRECCGLLGQGYESALFVTLSAGSQALPTLLKLASVMSNKRSEWQTMKQLPVEIELDREFQFHSIFACPVSREQSSADNPPMLLPCGHVLCKQSIVKLAKGNTRPFKCPYCPMEASSSHCRQIHF